MPTEKQVRDHSKEECIENTSEISKPCSPVLKFQSKKPIINVSNESHKSSSNNGVYKQVKFEPEDQIIPPSDKEYKNRTVHMTKEQQSVFEQILRQNGLSINSIFSPDAQTFTEELLKESSFISNPGKDSSNAFKPIHPVLTRQKPVKLWKLFVDPQGMIKEASGDLEEIFNSTDMINFNFFSLMARYNRHYYEELFGKHPILGISKLNSWKVLRFSLNHLDEDTNPIIITCKVTIKYSAPESDFPRRVIGAIIHARRSSSDSTKEFRGRILNAVKDAGKEAIAFMNNMRRKCTNASQALRQLEYSPSQYPSVKQEPMNFDGLCDF